MIQVEGLSKYYGAHAAIRDVGFTIAQGEVVGLLGLNGAGKSTTLKILGCVLLPTAGRVVIDGHDVVRAPHAVRERIGFLPDTPPLYDEMTVGGYLAFVAGLRGVPAREVRARVQEAEARAHLGDVDGAPISSLSHGFRQRVGLAQALVHRPQLLILDEPTGGLDPVQIVEMRALVRALRGEHTVLVSSHILSEISQTCDRLLVVHEGQLVAQGSEAELAQRAGSGGHVEVEVRGGAAAALAALAGLPARVLREEGGVVTLRVDAGAEARPQVARALVGAGLELLRLDRGAERLESIFLRLTQGSAGGGSGTEGRA